MMVKSAQPGEAGGCTPYPFTLSTITSKVVVYAPPEMADILPLFLLYPYMHSVGETERGIGRAEWKHWVESEGSGNSGVSITEKEKWY